MLHCDDFLNFQISHWNLTGNIVIFEISFPIEIVLEIYENT